MNTDKTSPQTQQAERREAGAAHEADRPATPEEAERAEQHDLDPEVAEHMREAARTGASVEGEGQITP